MPDFWHWQIITEVKTSVKYIEKQSYRNKKKDHKALLGVIRTLF